MTFHQREANDEPPVQPRELASKSHQRTDEPILRPAYDEPDDVRLLDLDESYWEALIPDDDYESLPEHGDFWTNQEAA